MPPKPTYEELERRILELEKAEYDRKKTEEALRESEERFRDIVDNSHDFICTHDLSGRILSANRQSVKMVGYEQNSILEMNLKDFLEPETRPQFKHYLEDIQKKGAARGLMAIQTSTGEKRIWEYNNTLRTEGVKDPIVRGIARDVTEQIMAEKTLKKTLKNLRKAMGGTIQALASVVEIKDPYTAGHQRRVADLARAIATEIGLSDKIIDGLRLGGIVHDIGKINVPAEILVKPGTITPLEFSLIQTHSEVGYELLKNIEFPWPIAEMVLQHHEKMDGSGYPAGLSGENICLEARILCVADVVEAMASNRPYRPALGIDAALDDIEKKKGIQFDPQVVDACLRIFRERGYQIKREPQVPA